MQQLRDPPLANQSSRTNNGCMAEAYELTIDLDVVRQHFTASDSRAYSNDDVLEWLKGSGFKLNGRTWVCEEETLDSLDPCEYRIVRRL